MNYKDKPIAYFYIFAGLSLWTISLGLSWSIAKSQDLVFGSERANLTLARQAVTLKQQEQKLRNITQTISTATNNGKIKQDTIRIEKQLNETSEQLDQVIEETANNKANN